MATAGGSTAGAAVGTMAWKAPETFVGQYSPAMADDAAARNRFLERDPIVGQAFMDSADEGIDPFDFFFDLLMDNCLDNPESVAEQAGVDVAASRRSAEQLVEERAARRLFQAAQEEAPEAL
jgi:hypothetical protein